MRASSVVLLSGGLDSAVNLALAKAKDQVVLALTADYGQRARESEFKAAAALASHYDIPHQTIDLRWLGELGGSALTQSSTPMPELLTSELDHGATIRASAKVVWVPNRNGVLINVAASVAERMGAKRVVVGFNREEATTFPDNSLDYLRRASDALALSTANGVEVFCYTTLMSKSELVAEVLKVDPKFPFQHLWSCYQNGAKPCGKCESCGRSARALAANGVKL